MKNKIQVIGNNNLVVWHKDSTRQATICYNISKDKVEFANCDFRGVGTRYTIDDWMFLKDLAEHILKQEI